MSLMAVLFGPDTAMVSVLLCSVLLPTQLTCVNNAAAMLIMIAVFLMF